MVVESVEALDSSRKEVEEDVFQLMRRLPTEHANPTFRSRLRSPIPGGVIVVPNQASGTSSSTSGGGMPGFILPADLELVAVYGYDAYNRRVIRVVVDDYVGGAWVTTYDGWREAVEHTVDISSGVQMVPVKQLVHGSDLDEILAYRRFNGTSWEDYHILHGGQDTAAKLVNQSGQVVEQYEYDPFGKATVYTAAGVLVDVGPAGTSPEDGTRSAYGLPHLYKAMRLDPETGNCYVRNRFYDPRTGRFMSRDPIGVWGDAGNMGNEYAYAWNRPLVVGDPLGLQALTPSNRVQEGLLTLALPKEEWIPRAVSKENRQAYADFLQRQVVFWEMPECKAFESWINFLAFSSETYEEFRQALGQNRSQGPISGRGHGSGPMANGGWNAQVGANGGDNYVHFASGLADGEIWLRAQLAKDRLECWFSSDGTEEKRQREAEIVMDLLTLDIMDTINEGLDQVSNDPAVPPGRDPAAWRRVSWVPGLAWRVATGVSER